MMCAMRATEPMPPRILCTLAHSPLAGAIPWLIFPSADVGRRSGMRRHRYTAFSILRSILIIIQRYLLRAQLINAGDRHPQLQFAGFPSSEGLGPDASEEDG